MSGGRPVVTGLAPGVRDAIRDLRAGRYLTAIRRLRQEAASVPPAPGAHNFLMWALNAVDPWGEGWRLAGGSQAPAPDPHGLVDPLPSLLTGMRERRAVVPMDGHCLPETQIFGAAILAVLRAAGATHLAFETVREAPIARFMRDGVARPTTEGYGLAPARAAVLRAARPAGMRIVAFDGPPLQLRAAARAMEEAGDHEALNRATAADGSMVRCGRTGRDVLRRQHSQFRHWEVAAVACHKRGAPGRCRRRDERVGERRARLAAMDAAVASSSPGDLWIDVHGLHRPEQPSEGLRLPAIAVGNAGPKLRGGHDRVQLPDAVRHAGERIDRGAMALQHIDEHVRVEQEVIGHSGRPTRPACGRCSRRPFPGTGTTRRPRAPARRRKAP